jgi:hypothetical protein
MARATRKRVGGAGYSYAQVEAALGALFRVPASAQGSFRARVRHLQRVGLVKIAPGKGRRISYTRIQANEWMLALLLAELGVDPIVIVKSVQGGRKELHDWIAEATDDEALGGNEVFLAIWPALMSGAWTSNDSAGILRFGKFRRHDSALKIPRHGLHAPRLVGSTSRPTISPGAALVAPLLPEAAQPAAPAHDIHAVGLTVGPPVFGSPELREIQFLDWAEPLLLVINLSMPVRELGAALDAALGGHDV